MKRITIFLTGMTDGWRQPIELTSGLTFKDDEILNETYDAGVNVGQDLRLVLHCLKAAILTQPHNLS